MKYGYRLRDLDDPESGLTLGDVIDIVEHADTSMAIYRATNKDHEWDLSSQLLASLFDFHQMRAWSEGDRKSRGPKPKPIPRPGVGGDDRETKTHKVEKTSTVTEIDQWLASRSRTA